MRAFDVGPDRTYTRRRLLDIEMASGLCQHVGE